MRPTPVMSFDDIVFSIKSVIEGRQKATHEADSLSA